MTKEEKNLLIKDLCSKLPYYYNSIENKRINCLIANHMDYRGLIPMGLALPATEGMHNL